MIFLIKLSKGVNNLCYGMSPDEVRRNVGIKWNSFKRTANSAYPCDYFESVGLFVYYNISGEAEAFEFARPAEVIFGDQDLLQLPFDQLTKLLLQQDPDLEIEPDGITSHKLCIGAYAPLSSEEPTVKSESIIVFEKGYYG